MYSPTINTISANPLPRFTGDWITAWINLDPTSGLLHIGAGPEEWLLEAIAPDKLEAALRSSGASEAEFNPELLVLMIPGAHEQAGSSFFRLRG
ncbi:hypothetical protein [Arthrobacter sp. MYb227]|uniref:hypothetical protein n=1 Tax=Arthrobacter sp. MYb227 TaxID=1848601 RepID=UPI0011AFE2BF|nr:hypothetical protein [Arthrobacter sp. MYb227]